MHETINTLGEVSIPDRDLEVLRLQPQYNYRTVTHVSIPDRDLEVLRRKMVQIE